MSWRCSKRSRRTPAAVSIRLGSAVHAGAVCKAADRDAGGAASGAGAQGAAGRGAGLFALQISGTKNRSKQKSGYHSVSAFRHSKKELSFFFHFSEALAAVYWAIFSWSERNFCFFAAASANSSEHFSVSFFVSFASVSACLASLWLVLEAFFCVEFLLTSGENELSSTLFAY